MILEEDLIRCFLSYEFSRTIIVIFQHRLDLLIRDMVELSFFREVINVSDESIRALLSPLHEV